MTSNMKLGVPILRGKSIKLSSPRRFILDLLFFAKQVPSIPMQRHMHLAALVEARLCCADRICWTAIFLKAMALLANDLPALRQTFMPWPWGRLYEHPESVGTFSVEKSYAGSYGVFFGQISAPDRRSLVELNAIVRFYKDAPVASVLRCRRAMQLSSMPMVFRRLAWWIGLFSHGGLRAHLFGTYGVSVVASSGAAGLHLLSPLTSTLNCGPLQQDGSLDVRLTYDHRVLDGAVMARAMVSLERILNTVIAAELRAGGGKSFSV